MTGRSKAGEADAAEGQQDPPQVAQGVGKGTGKGGKRLRAPGPAALTASTGSGLGSHEPSGSVPPGPGMVPREQVVLPLELLSRLHCRWKDGEFYRAKILERRIKPDLEPRLVAANDPAVVWEYYVHFSKMNRRMDQWVDTADFDLATLEVTLEEVGPDGKKRKKVVEELSDDEDHGDFDPQQLREHEEFTKVKNIDVIQLGMHEMETWYFSPLPPEYKDCKKLYFCEYSLHFFKRRSQLLRHLGKCKLRHPPGDEIYRKDNISMFEVDGRKEKQYCQNLCYLAKLFLDHKTLYYDVDLFLFYVLCETDARGAHIVGYFSKEKASEEGYNLACILTLPCYQKKGYGKFLIAFSYELSKLEGKVGTPERPLSDLGRVSYRSYWTRVLMPVLKERAGSVSIKDLSELTCIKPDDIIYTLQHLALVQYQKGQHVLVADPKLLDQHLREAGSWGLQVDPSKIIFTPYDASHEYATFKP
uniref:Histone acetyltransferase n=1 Tax=Tetradesmus obliquus TaxID=3088 RepID=A0A383W7X2_TETOB|eukprot:jgi/Sobl393_1/3227/SZX73747.1